MPVVWLTANPNIPFCFSSFHDWRVTAVVPSNRRLRRWSTFLCKRRIDPSPPGVPEFSRREGEQFYVHLGAIRSDRIRAVDPVVRIQADVDRANAVNDAIDALRAANDAIDVGEWLGDCRRRS